MFLPCIYQKPLFYTFNKYMNKGRIGMWNLAK
jgi:hypothetical protein